MSVIYDVIKEEYNRLNSLIELYDKKIAESLKGSLSLKKRGNNAYYYLAYRENKRIIFHYIGKEGSPQVQDYAGKIEARHKYEEMRKKSKENLKEIRKLLRAAI
ncbi:MAG: hypothetical protein DRP58_09250 [Spirochaetes bacterium]|nr:MAG: hypothetical protein DRP58_09250 [Spirochaetota bacterium]